ncbi:hypothetical protein GCM10012275_56090 [Longimycelium tulufanense]|uniref:Zinc-finger n=1 Tax=Longimycelium tulufanense TaxID=907463 RepID=A0A8J3FWL3_9PSEU|nr:zinc finger protein [Longimycelium tulufanense]GGM78231.1 hypothetical protein GCM10012275_56090 [Longimycelium tulufanense]
MSLDLIPLSWQPHDGRRHAYPGSPRVEGVAVTSLCQVPLIVRWYPPQSEEWLWPECDACHVAAQARAEQAQLDRLRPIEISLPSFGT